MGTLAYYLTACLQVLTIKTAVEDPETPQEQAVLLLERAREAKSPAARGQLLTKALQKLVSLPAVIPPVASGMPALALCLHTAH